MNWIAVISVGIVGLALIAFLVVRNIKDEKDFEHPLEDEFSKSEGSVEDTGNEDQAS